MEYSATEILVFSNIESGIVCNKEKLLFVKSSA